MTGERVVADVVGVASWETPVLNVPGILVAGLLFGVRNRIGLRPLHTEGVL